MSIAKQLIGEPAPKPAESKTNEAIEERPVHAQDLIDTLAEQEFGGSPVVDEANRSSTSVGHAFQKKKQKGTGGGYTASGKTTKGQVASAPGNVKYGKK
jgi:hypothetical protein